MALARDSQNENVIPVIDLSSSTSNSKQDVAKQLVEAAATHGFVFIKNLGHDISVSDSDRAFDISKKLFDSPIEEKQRYAIKKDNHGWVGMHAETLDAKNQRKGDFKEAFNLREFHSGKAQQPLPPALTPHGSDLSAFGDSCHALCLKLLVLFGIGLHVTPPDWFAARHSRSLGPSGCTLRLLYYPSIPTSAGYNPELDIRAGAHSDYGSLTLLFQRQGQPGLEILTSSGEWCSVPVTPPGTEDDPAPPILVNIGDLFSYWTKGLLRSTVHRVILPAEQVGRGGQDRYSIAYFCHPADETRLEPVPSEVVAKAKGAENGSPEGKVITAKEHLLERLKASYLQLDWDGQKKDDSSS